MCQIKPTSGVYLVFWVNEASLDWRFDATQMCPAVQQQASQNPPDVLAAVWRFIFLRWEKPDGREEKGLKHRETWNSVISELIITVQQQQQKTTKQTNNPKTNLYKCTKINRIKTWRFIFFFFLYKTSNWVSVDLTVCGNNSTWIKVHVPTLLSAIHSKPEAVLQEVVVSSVRTSATAE